MALADLKRASEASAQYVVPPIAVFSLVVLSGNGTGADPAPQ